MNIIVGMNNRPNHDPPARGDINPARILLLERDSPIPDWRLACCLLWQYSVIILYTLVSWKHMYPNLPNAVHPSSPSSVTGTHC